MLKKLLSVVALVTMLATQTAFAATDNSPLGSFTVTPTTFDPTAGEKLTATVTVTEPSLVNLTVVDPSTSKAVATIYSSKRIDTSYTTTYAGGLADGRYLSEGTWILNVKAANITGTIQAYDTFNFTVDYDNDEPPVLTECEVKSDGVIQNAEVDPCTWNPEDEDLEIVWELDDDVDDFTLTAEKSGEDDIELMDEEDLDEDDYSFEWDGTDEDGDEIEEGTWYIVFEADNDWVTIPVVVDYEDNNDDEVTGSCGSAQSLGVIEDADVDDCTWDPTEDDLEITWELNDDVDDFTLTAEKSGEDDVELMDEEDLDEDDYTFEWDGEDEDGDIVEEGTWYIVFEADNDKIRIPVKVSYDDDDNDNDDDIEITDIFVTKTSFDNDENEFTYVVFKLDDDAEVTVDVLKGTKKINTLVDEKELDGDVWHAIKWDGKDDDNDKVKEDNDYKFKVTAENDDNDKTSKTVTVEVKEDEVSSNKTNITNDSITPVIIDKDTTAGAKITYKLDDDAEVTVAIYKGDKTSGEEIMLEDEKDRDAGTYTITWDGRDEDNDKLAKNTKYSYLITAKVDGSSTKVDKERGYFVIGEGSTIGSSNNCTASGFWDVSTSSPYCEAIVWARENGIIDGYNDGSFRQYNYINRVEALKVALKAFSLPILSDNYTNLGFSDVDVGAWYMPYVRTGKFYGMIAGYAGTTLVKPASEISRTEILRYILEAAEASRDYTIPACNSSYYTDTNATAWYSDYVCVSHDYDLFETYSGRFYPGVKATRGEVVLALYKMSQEGLLK